MLTPGFPHTAAELFWKAVLFPSTNDICLNSIANFKRSFLTILLAKGYTVEEAMRNFFTCYQKRDVLDQGFVYVARRYHERGGRYFVEYYLYSQR